MGVHRGAGTPSPPPTRVRFTSSHCIITGPGTVPGCSRRRPRRQVHCALVRGCGPQPALTGPGTGFPLDRGVWGFEYCTQGSLGAGTLQTGGPGGGFPSNFGVSELKVIIVQRGPGTATLQNMVLVSGVSAVGGNCWPQRQPLAPEKERLSVETVMLPARGPASHSQWHGAGFDSHFGIGGREGGGEVRSPAAYCPVLSCAGGDTARLGREGRMQTRGRTTHDAGPVGPPPLACGGPPVGRRARRWRKSRAAPKHTPSRLGSADLPPAAAHHRGPRPATSDPLYCRGAPLPLSARADGMLAQTPIPR